MRCEHAESTTIAWLYGEADEAHAEHVAQCVVCRSVAAEHADVVAALGPALAAVRAPERPSRWGRGLMALAVAALLGVAVLGAWPEPAAPPAPAVVSVEDGVSAAIAASSAPLPAADAFDAEIDALDLELEHLTNDLEML